MNAVFRVDASIQMGSGHVMRCLTLAEQLRSAGMTVRFVCRLHPGHLIDLIEQQGYTVYRLTQSNERYEPVEGQKLAHSRWLGVTQEEDARAVSVLWRGKTAIDWLVVDHYALGVAWESSMRPHARKIMVIDDLADRQHDCDVLLDQNLHSNIVAQYRSLVPSHCNLILGPKFALLRPEFGKERGRLRDRDGIVQRILVFFGGSDLDNVTSKALNALDRLNRSDITIDVVVGGENPNRHEMQAWCEKRSNSNYHFQISNMAELMARADLALGAGGSTTWERCAMGLPSLIISIADNQVAIADAVDREGAAIYLGPAPMVSVEHIVEKLRELMNDHALLSDMSERAYQLSDGKGVVRIHAQLVGLK